MAILRTTPCKGYTVVVERRSPLPRLQELAQDQWGLVTRRQAELAGVGRTTLDRLTGPTGSLERVTHGVYRLVGAPTPDHLELRAAWLQLAPEVPAWTRTANQGVVSHRSAASVYGVGHLSADRHEFTIPHRRQTRRADVRIHVRQLEDREWVVANGLPVTRPSRIVPDLLMEHEDPEAVGQIVAESLRRIFDYPGTFADALAPYAVRFGLRRNDGLGLLRWFLELTGDPDMDRWMGEAVAHSARVAAKEGATRMTPKKAGPRAKVKV